MPDTPFSLKLYRFLLKFYPVGFHDDYAGPMEREFRDELAESSSIFALARLWIRLLADLAVSIPLQFLREVLQDARHTLRLWRNRPCQTGFAVLALAIGIGANTGVFSVVNALLLRSLPFHDPSRLVSLGTFFPPHDSAKDFHEWRQQQRAYLSDAALVEQFDVNLGEVPNPKRAHISVTSWNFFSILGAQPVIGRFFQEGEDEPRNNSVAVISYGLWQQLFAGDQRALGSTLRANGKPVTIIGVAPPGFSYPSNTDLWKAAEYSPGNNGWETIARLKPGVTGPQAHAAFTVEVERLWPQRDKLGNSEQHPRMISLQDELAGPAKNASLMLMVGVVLILLIACSNIANLLMARTADRAAEISIRCALGASRARIAQQLLTECLLLSFVAAAAGLFVALWTTTLAASVQPTPLSTQTYSLLDGRVLAFTIAMAIASSVVFGVLPSVYAGRAHAFAARGSAGTRSARQIREMLVGVQVMLTIILLTAAISVGRAFISLMRTDRGFNTNGLVTVSVSLTGTTHDTDGRQLPYFEEALARIRGLPGVRSTSETEFLPLDAKGFVGGPFKFDGREAKQNSTMIPVFGDYFKTMGGRVVYGREFNDAEVRADAGVAVVNERFAAEFVSPSDAIDHEISIGKSARWKIIGVVKGMDYMTDTMDTAHSNQIFVPAHEPDGFVSTFVVRVNGRAEDSLPAIRDTIRSVDTQVPIFGVKTMDQRMADVVARPKFYRTALLFFASFALLLAVIGIYGVVSYAVARRTHEMGVRLALGATPVMLRGKLIRQGLMTVAVGAICGIIGAIVTGHLFESFVEGANSADPATLILSILFIVLVASASTWAGTRRIAQLDIMDILRIE
jgi:predicted permease